MTELNRAAWLPARRRQLAVSEAAHPSPGRGEIVVRTRAVAVNPADWIIQSTPRALFPWVKGPAVLGTDVAGEVAQVGAGVSRFSVGDRVLGHALGLERGHDRQSEGAFQLYSVLREHMTSAIPDTLDFAHAAVLPLGVSTAASALFQADQLHLARPTANAPRTGMCVVIAGGATSVGHNAIQLAHAAGYEVITTCSPHNEPALRRLGAETVIDYHSPRVVEEIIHAIGRRHVSGALAIGPGSAGDCIRVLSRTSGRRFVAQIGGMPSAARLGDGLARLPGVVLEAGALQVGARIAARRSKVTTGFVWGSSLADNEVGRLVYGDFLAAALADGRYRAAPEPLIVGDGLSQLQAALDRQRAGVSAQKVVVTLDHTDR